MKGRTGTIADGQTIRHVDKKRWLWMLAVIYPLQPFISIGMHAKTGDEAWFIYPFIYIYIIAPIITPIINRLARDDRDKPPERLLKQLDQDVYYRLLTYIVVPLHFITLCGAVWYATAQPLSTWAFILLAVYAGMVAGLAINTAHELGHKNSKIEKQLADFLLAIPAYGHFRIGHNQGHHKHVSTAADPASSRMGESIYRFARREISGTFHSAWKIEKERLNECGHSVWHPKNQILQSYAISAFMSVAFLIAFGWLVIPFLLIHNAMAYWQLTSTNYIEHYGLLRKRDDSGKLERCERHHSWNGNHTFTNPVLFHLERHSDHHANPLRRYQSLQHLEDVPKLPNGYFGMYVLAYFPWLWFKIMDKRLMALPHVGGDLNSVNIDPAAQPSIFLKWGMNKRSEPTYTEPPGA